ncbi:MAG: hypothetical protein R2730_14730 [Chitinophagales bacterium]
MKKISLSILYLFLLTTGYTNAFQINTIGVVYLNSSTQDEYELTIVFPMSAIPVHNNYIYQSQSAIVDSLKVKSDVVLFDNKGIIGKITDIEIAYIQFWCENDDGIQFRPEIKIMINKNQLVGELQAQSDLQNLSCFAIINYDQSKLHKVEREHQFNLEMEGDINNDGINEIEIYSYYDDAENCDGLPINHLVVVQKTGSTITKLRCCGP